MIPLGWQSTDRRLRPWCRSTAAATWYAAGEMDVVEGTTPAGRVMVVVEFPSLEAARAWYNDPEYAPLIKLRQTGSEAEIVLVDGL